MQNMTTKLPSSGTINLLRPEEMQNILQGRRVIPIFPDLRVGDEGLQCLLPWSECPCRIIFEEITQQNKNKTQQLSWIAFVYYLFLIYWYDVVIYQISHHWPKFQTLYTGFACFFVALEINISIMKKKWYFPCPKGIKKTKSRLFKKKWKYQFNIQFIHSFWDKIQ